jgi:hypothetical protein
MTSHFPTATLALETSRVRGRGRPSPRSGGQADHCGWPSSWKPDAPENRNPTWKPNQDPHLEGTGITLTISDTTMTSDQNPHTARPPARKGSVLASLISHHYQFRGETGLHGPPGPRHRLITRTAGRFRKKVTLIPYRGFGMYRPSASALYSSRLRWQWLHGK